MKDQILFVKAIKHEGILKPTEHDKKTCVRWPLVQIFKLGNLWCKTENNDKVNDKEMQPITIIEWILERKPRHTSTLYHFCHVILFYHGQVLVASLRCSPSAIHGFMLERAGNHDLKQA